MKDITRKALEESRPRQDALHCIGYVLKCLYRDPEKQLSDRVADCCTYEELIGALLKARDELRERGNG